MRKRGIRVWVVQHYLSTEWLSYRTRFLFNAQGLGLRLKLGRRRSMFDQKTRGDGVCANIVKTNLNDRCVLTRCSAG